MELRSADSALADGLDCQRAAGPGSNSEYQTGARLCFQSRNGRADLPIEDREVLQTEVPGNYTSATQPYPTWPEPVDRIIHRRLTEELVIDYTPELKEEAMTILSGYRIGGLYDAAFTQYLCR